MNLPLLILDGKYFGLKADGSIVEIVDAKMLAISTDRSLLNVRRQMLEFNYNRNPKGSVRPPWIKE